ncbi:hypothetical protein SH1V18_16820 [Vallitalea longa]|uniref:Peptidase S74 domain-containing protein n=1 Tax=Vallitalea longa TaxID=2936439 RepID=A0A9W5Y973_9FIRM|nr:tail fiber domain-containing protein [Vallitalea longa]GKX29202.1 hypothetical protein SH1V18_16820 [Vallitalea longa]
MHTTSNLKLKKPEGTDVVNIEDINSNMDKLDVEVAKKVSHSTDGRMSKEDKTKLDGIASGANKYVHPSTHSIDMISETSSKKVMTSSERSKLAGIASGANKYVHPSTHSIDMIKETSSKKVMTSSERSKLAGIASGANKYVHPSKHSAGVITQDSSHRFVTDSEKSSWNSKADGAPIKVDDDVEARNTIIGYSTFENNTTGVYNTAIGYGTLKHNTTGFNNDALGVSALNSNTTGVHNTAMGSVTLSCNTTGRCNTATGSCALKSNTTGTYNTATGRCALENNTTGAYNTGIGYNALENNTTGDDNIAIGYDALEHNTTGNRNTAIGYNALWSIINDKIEENFSNCSGLGAFARVSASNQVQLGDSDTTTYAFGSVQNRSDKRDKADIQDTNLGLDFILKLRPVEYRWDYRDSYIEEVEDENGDKTLKPIPKDGSKKGKRFHQGFIAQEVKDVIDNTGIDFAGYQDHSINGGCDVLSLGYTEFIAPMVKAIQEQQQIIDDLKKRIEILESR